ncbi:MAG: hypothetical protein Q7J67_00800, partial [bacterium]|nr:hypothetical protein [bacterium]
YHLVTVSPFIFTIPHNLIVSHWAHNDILLFIWGKFKEDILIYYVPFFIAVFLHRIVNVVIPFFNPSPFMGETVPRRP